MSVLVPALFVLSSAPALAEEPVEPVSPEAAAPVPAAPPPWSERIRIGVGAILWYYRPLQGDVPHNVELYFANATIDADAGPYGFHIEPRISGSRLRPFYDGPAWVQEVYVSRKLGPVTVKAGKIYKQLGLFWDDSFYGNVLCYDGLKLAPDYGVSLEGAPVSDPSVGLRFYGQFFVVDGRTNVSLQDRDTISIVGARRRNEVVGRVEPFVKLGDDGVAKVGVSGEYLQADLPEGKQDVVRVGADATVKVGPVGVWGEVLRQDGRTVDAFPVAADPAAGTSGAASAHNDYLLAGGSVTFGPVTARYNGSWGRYADLDVTETMHVPAVGVALHPSVTLLAEVVRWRRQAPSGDSVVDDSLDLTLHARF